MTPCKLPAHTLLLSLLLTPARHIFHLSPHAPRARGSTMHAQTNKAGFVSFRCHRCRAHCYALHPLLSLTSRRGRQRSTLPDSLSFNVRCRVSHAHKSAKVQTNRQTTIPGNSHPAVSTILTMATMAEWPQRRLTMTLVHPVESEFLSPSPSWGPGGTGGGLVVKPRLPISGR